jgi:hypothetical protein
MRRAGRVGRKPGPAGPVAPRGRDGADHRQHASGGSGGQSTSDEREPRTPARSPSRVAPVVGAEGHQVRCERAARLPRRGPRRPGHLPDQADLARSEACDSPGGAPELRGRRSLAGLPAVQHHRAAGDRRMVPAEAQLRDQRLVALLHVSSQPRGGVLRQPQDPGTEHLLRGHYPCVSAWPRTRCWSASSWLPSTSGCSTPSRSTTGRPRQLMTCSTSATSSRRRCTDQGAGPATFQRSARCTSAVR